MRLDEPGPRLSKDEIDLDNFRFYAAEVGRALLIGPVMAAGALIGMLNPAMQKAALAAWEIRRANDALDPTKPPPEGKAP